MYSGLKNALKPLPHLAGAGIAFAVVLCACWQAAVANPQIKAGDKAVAAGKYQKAVRAYTRAMTKGELKPGETALVLVSRGKSYLNLDKPAEAIADITKALWLRKLSGTDRAKALQIRAQSYREVGMVPLARRDQLAAKKGGGLSVAAREPAQGNGRTKPGKHVSRQTSTAAITSFQTQIATTGGDRKATTAKRAGTTAAPNKTAIPAFRTTIKPEAETNPSKSAGLSGQGNSVAGFFGGLFGGNKSGSAARQRASQPTAPAAAPATAGDWSSSTTIQKIR